MEQMANGWYHWGSERNLPEGWNTKCVFIVCIKGVGQRGHKDTFHDGVEGRDGTTKKM